MYWITAIAAAVITFLVCLGLHTLDVDRITAANVKAVADQVQFDIKKCEAEKEITTNVSNDYEKQIDTLNGQLNSLRHAAPRIVYVKQPAGGHHAAAKQSINGSANAIDSVKFYDYAGTCETDRLKVIGLQKFINEVWALADPASKGIY